MRLFFLLFLLIIPAFASTILSFKVYERSDRTDILFTFDTPYEGRISKKVSDGAITLHLYDALYSQSRTRQISSKFINSFSLVPEPKKSVVILNVMPNMGVKVSKTVDSYGLRLRIEPKNSSTTSATNTEPSSATNLSSLKSLKQSPSNGLPHAPETLVNSRYITVMAILILAVILLYWFKRKVDKKGNSWLFKNVPSKMDDFKILFQKPIDNQNKVVLMEYASKQYLAIIGTSNLLLDVVKDKEAASEEGFDAILKENQQELDKYLELESNEQEQKDPFQTIKERASIEAYQSHS